MNSLSTLTTLFAIPEGLGAAGRLALKTQEEIFIHLLVIAFYFYFLILTISPPYSTRVSNELGAGNPRAARVAVGTVIFLAVLEAVIVSSALFVGRNSFGYFFSNESEVVDYVSNIAPLVCVLVILNSLHGVLSGCFYELSHICL